jgi:hypothetical protein
MVAASGTLAAIADAFGGKRSKAMASLRKALGQAGGGGEVADLRKRLSGIVAEGQRAS